MVLDRTEFLLTRTLLLREQLVDRTIERERTEAEYYQAIRNLHGYGLTLRSIGKAVRLSHQRVHQITSNPQRALERQRRRVLPFKRGTPWSFSERTAGVIERAHAERCQRGHPCVDVEHLVLALLAVGDRATTRALEALGVDAATAHAALTRHHPDADPKPPTAALHIGASARVAMELARKEADRRQSKLLEPGHLLVGLALVGDAFDDSFLRDAGVTADRVRAELSR
jgi:hypothetical protein